MIRATGSSASITNPPDFPGADMKAGTLGHVLKQAGLNENETESGDAAD